MHQRTCVQPRREDCYIAAHDAKTGKEAVAVQPRRAEASPAARRGAARRRDARGGDVGAARRLRPAAPADLWGVANPTPNTRADRHDGKSDAIPTSVAGRPVQQLHRSRSNPDTGKLAWYFQHLPGDDWDEDYTHERTLVRTAVQSRSEVRQVDQPDVKRGEQRDVSVMVGEGGGIFVNDRATGQFLWATPFPFDTPNFLITNIDVKTGRVPHKDKLFRAPASAT